MLPQNDLTAITAENMDALDKPQYQEASVSQVKIRD
jgi:hypothetical protein